MSSGRPRAGSSASALLLTVLGELVLPGAEAVWTRTVVSTLGLVGVSEPSARQALARTAAQGFLRRERHGRSTRWHLTPSGRRLLASGTERIYGFGAPAPEWDGRWLVVLCPVPEDQRAKRHQLRRRLEFAGFGFLGPATAITPHPEREHVADAVLRDLDLVDVAAVFRGEAGALIPAEVLLQRAWDLAGLAARYRGFVRAVRGRSPRTPDGQLAALVMLVHEWRRFPFVDPEIPDELLPSGWVGHRAKDLFDVRHAAWAPGAHAAFTSMEEAGGPLTTSDPPTSTGRRGQATRTMRPSPPTGY